MTAVDFDGGMKRLQICMFDSDFYLQQVRILLLESGLKDCYVMSKIKVGQCG